jgi:sugar O-acyltransferase (sialic acid O-acetyltransferase NeuD family)
MSGIRDRMVIVGASGHGIVAMDAARQQQRYEIAGWLESNKPAGQVVAGSSILGRPDQVSELMREHRFSKVFLGISDNWTRRIVWEKMRTSAPDLELVSILHPASVVSDRSTIGAGTLILAGAIVNCGCTVGENCIINTNASLDHDSEMKPYASILPGVATGGGVVIGEYSCVCLGAVISHRVKIGEHAFIGAGSVVLKDIPPYVLAYGAPARVVRSRTQGERHF